MTYVGCNVAKERRRPKWNRHAQTRLKSQRQECSEGKKIGSLHKISKQAPGNCIYIYICLVVQKAQNWFDRMRMRQHWYINGKK